MITAQIAGPIQLDASNIWIVTLRDNDQLIDQQEFDQADLAFEYSLQALSDYRAVADELALDRGRLEAAAWYDTSAELN